MPDFTPVSTLASSLRFVMGRQDSPPEPPDDADLDAPPEPDEDGPQDPPLDAQEPSVRVPDEILAPEQLVDVPAIVARVEGITAADVAQSVLLAERALAVKALRTDDEQAALDGLRDALKAHQATIEAKLDPYVTLANRLHKGLTGLRSNALGRVPEAVKHAGTVLAAYIRQKEEAEAARQRAEREKALAEERARLQAEAEAAETERRRLAAAAEQALESGDDTAAAQLQARAEEEARAAAEARQDAATVAAPPVVAHEVAKPTGASTRDNWQALPASAESWDDFPLKDKTALIIFIGQRLAAGDGSFIHLLDVSKKACTQLAKAQKSTMKVPGIRAVNPPVYSKATRG